jgi:membrane associated rhomboid family serine protease
LRRKSKLLLDHLTMMEPTGHDSSKANVVILKTFLFSIGRVWLFLCVIPSVLTYFHLQQQVDRHWETVSSSVSSHSAEIGLYGRLREGNVDSAASQHYYRLLPSSSWWNFVPDVVDAAEAARPGVKSSFPHIVVPVYAGRNESSAELCLFLSLEHKLCGNDAIAITPANRRAANTAARRHPLRSIALEQPATHLLLFSNVLLAVVYWNCHVNVESVALLSYTRLMERKEEIWRVFTGSTAHFDLWHLGLNMMSLTALGAELEGRRASLYSSIAFFFYNLTLIPLVSAIHLGLQYLRQAYSNHDVADANRPTVGYSGVLFAWMVVAALGQTSTCPIIFLPSLCFPTYALFGMIPFSWAPLVQLVVLQVILPRVSFTGHCAGIVAGFLLHWGWLPIRYVQPAIAIPLLYLLYLQYIRKVALPLDTSQTGSSSRWNLQLRYQLVPLLYSVTILGPFSSATLSFLLTMVYWYQLDQSLTRSSDSITATIWAKGYILAAVLVMVTDSMTMGGWIVFGVDKFFPWIVLILRIASLTYGIVLAQAIVPKETDGIFEWTLNYTTLRPCREWVQSYPTTVPAVTAHPAMLPSTTASESSAFVGVGRRLGGGTTSVNPWKVRGDEKQTTARERDQ